MGSRIFTSVLCIFFLNIFSGAILGDNELAGVEIQLCIDKSSFSFSFPFHLQKCVILILLRVLCRLHKKRDLLVWLLRGEIE